MDIDDKELFSSAMTDAEIPDVADPPAEAPTTEAPQQDDRPRDEHGRFAPKQPVEPEPEPQAPPQAAQAATDEAQIPPWRLREMREERDAANQRYQETQRQLEMLQRQMPKPEPQLPPDLFENPQGAIEFGARQLLTPIEKQQQALLEEVQHIREENSRWRAERDHGPEAVRSGYDWVAQGVQARDPTVVNVYNQAMQSRHPFDVIVKAHKELSLVQQINAAGGPDKWREQQLAAAQPVRQQSSQPQGSITKLPPSLRNVPSARGNGADDDSDMSDAAIFRQSMR
jgi:hypothetical protein